jgi:hypothetical protein
VAAGTGAVKKNQTCAPLPERERSTDTTYGRWSRTSPSPFRRSPRRSRLAAAGVMAPTGVEDGGSPLPRPEPGDGVAPPAVDARARRVLALMAALTGGVLADRAERSEEQQARWLLAHLLDWHRREDKAPGAQSMGNLPTLTMAP